MQRKTRILIFSLFLMAFSTSTFLSIPGVIPVISEYYSVSLEYASLFVALFTFILAVTGLFLPGYFANIERKKFFIACIAIFILSGFFQMIVPNFYIALVFRIIPAFVYSSVISISLTVMSEISPKNVNRVILGVSSGTILGLSISTFIGMDFGFQAVNLWLTLINVVALIFIFMFFPTMPGKSKKLCLPFNNIASIKFLVTTLFIVFVGISVSILYNYFSVILLLITKIEDYSLLSLYLFFNGFASMFGTVFYGYFLMKNSKLAVFTYPISFSIVIFLFAMLVRIPIAAAILLVAFGFLDGSMHTIVQYWITSANKENPEFANGYYLFINNLNRTVGIFIGAVIIDNFNMFNLFYVPVVLLLCSLPFVLFRIIKYPESVPNVT